jgi:hypothetical protein
MSCRHASEIDLLGFLDDPRRQEFAEFREHYPRCRDCAAELRVWTELHAALRATRAASAHPEPEQLARYEGAPGGLAPAERRALEAHLATCPACRDELRALRGWTPVARIDPASARAAAPAPRGEWLAALRRLLWHPALAYALLAAFVAPTVYRQVVGGPPVIEQPAKPAGLASSEEARPVEEAPAADAARGVAPETRPPEDIHAVAREPEPKPSAEPARAAPQPPPTVARMAPPEEPAAAERIAPELGAARAVRPVEADPELARTRSESAAPAPPEDTLAAELGSEDAIGEALAEHARFAQAPAAPAPAPALALQAGESPRVSAASARAGLRLSFAAPEPGELEIRVVAPAGERELRERRVPEGGTATIEVPPDWLAPGHYEVSVRRLGAGLVTDEASFGFDVEGDR